MSKAIRTRAFILDKTAPVFNRQGYSGTTLSDLTKVTGLTKGALYGNFKDKQGIAAAAFKHSMEKVRRATLANTGKANTSKDKLLHLFEFFGAFVMNPPVPGGCPMMNAAVEADDYQVFIRTQVADEIKRTIRYFATLLREGVQAGEFKTGIKPMEIASMFFCSIEGAIVISRITSSRAPMNAVLNHCKSVLEQISK